MHRTLAALATLAVALLMTAHVQPQDMPKVEWTMDLAKAKIPDSPVSGKVHGKNFKIVFAAHEKGSLIFRIAQGKEAPEESIDINFFNTLKPGDTLEGRKFEFSPEKFNPKDPGVIITSLQPKMDLPKKEIVIPGEYALKLEFGKRKNGVIPGKIFFANKDKATYVAGKFELKTE